MVGPPTFFVALMQSPGFSATRVESLRLVSSGGAGVSDAFVAEASERLGCVVKRTYGSTEAPSVATALPGAPDDAPRAIAPCELRIDEEGGGELFVRGPEVCAGYLDAPDTERMFTPDGWYRTGDLATIDGAGRLAIRGRLDDVIIRGGENISATEVAALIERHPAVRQCAVIGIADDLMGERACAFVVADGGFDLAECARWCAAEGLARYKTPERVIMLDALPALASGKPDRAALTCAGVGGQLFVGADRLLSSTTWSFWSVTHTRFTELYGIAPWPRIENEPPLPSRNVAAARRCPDASVSHNQ